MRPCRPYDAISSLLRQLCEHKDVSMPTSLADSLRKLDDKLHGTIDDTNEDNQGGARTRMSLGELVSYFLALQLHLGSVYICLDGLEECEDLLTMFKILARLASSPAKLIITARP